MRCWTNVVSLLRRKRRVKNRTLGSPAEYRTSVIVTYNAYIPSDRLLLHLKETERLVTVAKKTLDSTVAAMTENAISSRVIARRLFLYDSSIAFANDKARGFTILNEVRDRFKVPFSAVRIVGSAQLGYSYFSRRDFLPTVSDLDLAIVSPTLFQQYSELVYWVTKRYTDLSNFDRKDGISSAPRFRNYLSEGMFRPDLMPKGSQKDEWFSFFNQLSNKHADIFKSVNAGIYLSEGFFEMRNSTVVDRIGEGRK